MSNLGLLSRFVGMLTDSRSFLSYARHEYFRRLLCNLLGNDVARGALPNEPALLGELVEDVSYRNARDYFKFDDVTRRLSTAVWPGARIQPAPGHRLRWSLRMRCMCCCDAAVTLE